MTRKCRFSPNATCGAKGTRTKVACLQCILSRNNKFYATLISFVTTTFEVSMGNAGFVYRTLKAIYDTNNDFLSWLEKYYPNAIKRIDLHAEDIEAQIQRFTKKPKGFVV